MSDIKMSEICAKGETYSLGESCIFPAHEMNIFQPLHSQTVNMLIFVYY